MGRLKSIPPLLIIPLLLSGCFAQPAPIRPELSTASIGGNPNRGSLSYQMPDIHYGDEGPYIVDSDGSHINVYVGSSYSTETPEEHFATIPVVTFSSEESEPIVTIPEIEDITFDNAHTFTEQQLFSYYGSHNNLGYYNPYGDFYCTETGQVGNSTDLSYADAVAQYTSLYGEPDLYLSKNRRKFTYWFESSDVFCVSSYDECVSISKSEYYSNSEFTYIVPANKTIADVVESNTSESHILTLLYNEYGKPYHEDFYNYIFKTQDAFYVIERESCACTIIRR